MCGIIGRWNLDGAPVDLDLLAAAADAMAHRGPDDEGYVALDPAGETPPVPLAGRRTAPGVREAEVPYAPRHGPGARRDAPLVLGQTRLAIIDLSPRGHQPMCNEDGSVWVTFGGEIYNYRELRDSLADRGHRFRSETDTEVLVHGYELWGEDLLERLNGMWALAIWDARRRLLFCARDRLGIKPFYYMETERSFAFASEIAPLRMLARAAGADPAPNGRVIHRFIERAQVDTTDETFFEGVRSLGAGHYLLVRPEGPRFRRYWDLTPPAADLGAAGPVGADDAASVDLASRTTGGWAAALRERLAEAVILRLRADVPVGTCLSGGLDSSSVITLGTRQLAAPMDAYSVAYDEGDAYDERRYMELVVQATGARHHLVVPTAEGLFEQLEQVVRTQQEPAAGPGILSQWHVMRLAAGHGAKVLLDGQGGDELFGGYFAFYYPLVVQDLWRAGRRADAWRFARTAVAAGHRPLEVAGRVLEPFLPAALVAAARARLGTGGGWERVLADDFRRTFRVPPPPRPARFPDRLSSRLYWDLVRDILPSLLRYEDRNSMAFSIEARVPFLDVHVVELAFAMPGAVKAADALTKQVLRQAMQGVVPEPILARTDKRGFETPVVPWLRRHHAGALVDLLVSGRAVERGILDGDRTRRAVEASLAGGRGAGHDIWRLVHLELWLRSFFDAT
jgi:asparagine synthase (glutamine-hydrolysing)